MGLTEQVGIGKRNFTVKEITLQQIRDIDQLQMKSDIIPAIVAACTDAAIDELLPLSPSEIEPLVDGVIKVNAAFFRMATKAKEVEVAQLLEQKIRLISMISFFCSSE